MDKLKLSEIAEFGEDPIPDGKNNTYVFKSKNVSLCSNVSGDSSSKEAKNNFLKTLKEELSAILMDSKNLMFTVQVTKFTKCADVVGKDVKFEILSITCPSTKTTEDKKDSLILEVMIQKTKFGQINIHKALVEISILCIEKLSMSKTDVKFETKVKIINVETQAAITVYFVLKALSLIFGNLSLFSSNQIVRKPEFDCKVLLPEQYNQNEKKRKYTTNYIKQSINYLIQDSKKTEKSDEENDQNNKKVNDHINRLLMLGVVPSSVQALRKYLGSQNGSNISEESINMVTSVNNDEDVHKLKGKLN